MKISATILIVFSQRHSFEIFWFHWWCMFPKKHLNQFLKSLFEKAPYLDFFPTICFSLPSVDVTYFFWGRERIVILQWMKAMKMFQLEMTTKTSKDLFSKITKESEFRNFGFLAVRFLFSLILCLQLLFLMLVKFHAVRTKSTVLNPSWSCNWIIATLNLVRINVFFFDFSSIKFLRSECLRW